MSQRYAIEQALAEREVVGVPCVSVDAMQGREVDFLLLSLVRTVSDKAGLGFVTHRRRVNVALSRGRHQIMSFGSLKCLSGVGAQPLV